MKKKSAGCAEITAKAQNPSYSPESSPREPAARQSRTGLADRSPLKPDYFSNRRNVNRPTRPLLFSWHRADDLAQF
jgi:hypothetical protein